MSRTYKLQPLVVGTFTAIPLGHFIADASEGERIQAPCLSWLARGESGDHIVVDTGPGDPAQEAAQHHYPFVREADQRIDRALEGIGVDPAAVAHVILTHLHFDHCADGVLLPNATFYVQRAELDYAERPDPRQERAYDLGFAGVEPAWWAIRDRIVAVDGDVDLTPGCRILHTPGHTPGSASAVFSGPDGVRYAVAGDLISRTENWADERGRHVVPGLTTSENDCQRSSRKLAASADVVLASHDERMLGFHSSHHLRT